ncbi:MAG: hypothetical protein HYS32_01030 [Candidatus Woesearchaeota archaeon]|nr:MAG: hypothetical protein HYS32_01030 [Candidatus Woesearchaeota archaeon]
MKKGLPILLGALLAFIIFALLAIKVSELFSIGVLAAMVFVYFYHEATLPEHEKQRRLEYRRKRREEREHYEHIRREAKAKAYGEEEGKEMYEMHNYPPPRSFGL